MNDAVKAVSFTVLLVGSVLAPGVLAAPADDVQAEETLSETSAQTERTVTDREQPQQTAAGAEDELDYEQLGERLRALASVEADANVTLSDERRAAATRGARTGAQVVQQQGVEVNQSQREAAVDASVRAAAQVQNASVEQIQAAARGATRGALLQSQRANVTQVQAGIYGGTAGALSQSQQANVTQLQSAAYGAAHGVVAQHQRANVSQLQFAAVGAAAGAAHAERANQTQQVVVTQIQEAAQGGAYGALVQRQNVTVTQIQAAAFGAAGGGASSDHDADPKQIQEAAMGAAEGTLTQRQNVTVTQIQAAARGASHGALAQSQNVTVTQIQQASFGAAQGALFQSQSVTVRQIQSAAFGAASGVLVQTQSVSIVQIQQAAYGAARGAAQTAAQRQIVDVSQIQAAAAGAGQGTIVQIQQLSVVQIQTVASSAASGALSQSQNATVEQIQFAAVGASEGATLLTQRQEITIEQLQERTERAAADTVRISVRIEVVNQVTIVNYARGAVTDQPDEDPDRLRSLFAAVDDETLFLANPNDVTVTVTLTRDGDTFETITLSPGESVTRTLDPGQYTLTAESEDGQTVTLAGRTRLRLSVGDELRSLAASVDGQRLTVENPNDQRVSVSVSRNGGTVASFDVPRDWAVSERLDPGTYTVSARAADGRRVSVNGRDSAQVTVESTVIDLSASLDDRTLTVDNPGDRSVTVRVASAGGERSFAVGAGETVTQELTPVSPAGHVVTATAPDREVLVNGLRSYTVFVPLPPTVDLGVTVDGRNVTVRNPSDTAATVTATDESGAERTISVAAGEQVTEAFDAGNYTLTGVTDEADRTVRLNGQERLAIEIEEQPPEPANLSVSVDRQNVTVENPSDVAVTVTADPESGEDRTVSIPAGEQITEAFDPGTYALTGSAADARPVLLNGEERLTIEIEEEPPEPANLSVSVAEQNVSVENPSEVDVTVTAAPESGQDSEIAVSAGESVTRSLEPGNYTLTGAADDDRAVRLNGQTELDVQIEAPVPEPVDLSVGVDEQNVTVENPSDTAVSVTAASEGEEQAFDVPAAANATERFDPGNYTLTGTADDGRAVTLDGNESLAVRILSPGPDRTIGACRNITQPGRYTLTSDIQSTSNRSCIRIQASNVTLDGADHSIDGTGPVGGLGVTEANAGVFVADVPDERIENVTVRNLSATGWNAGLQVDTSGLGGPGDVRFENATVRQNEQGVSLRGTDATMANLTATNNDVGVDLSTTGATNLTNLTLDENRIGLAAVESSSVRLRSATVANSTDEGVLTSAFVSLAIEDTVVRNGSATGIRLQGDDGGTLSNVTVQNNSGAGVTVLSSTGTTTIASSNVSDNGGIGVRVAADTPTRINDSVVGANAGGIDASSNLTVRNVTLFDNASPSFDARDGNATATDLQFGRSTTVVAFENQSIALDPVAVGSLPPLPGNATAIEDGLDVAGLDDVAQIEMTYVADDENESVELWRWNGTNWSTLGPDAAPGDGVVEQSVDQDGLYAPVRPAGTALDLTVTVGNRGVWIENPTDVTVDVAVSNDSGIVLSRAFAPGTNESIGGLDPGDYTLAAATDEGDPVTIDGAEERTITLPPDLASLGLTVTEDNVTVENPNDVAATLRLENESGIVGDAVVAPGTTAVIDRAELSPGEYTVRATTDDGRDAPVNGEWNLTVTLTAVATPTETQTATGTETATGTATETETVSPTETATETETAPATLTPTATETATPTTTQTPTQTETPTPTQTETATEAQAQTTEPTDESETAAQASGAPQTDPLAELFEAIEEALA